MSDPFPNAFSSLPPALAARAQAIVAQREGEGLNVHFINLDGQADRRSFATKERADAFRASLERNGQTILEGEAR
jgi:hypothetical protein